MVTLPLARLSTGGEDNRPFTVRSALTNREPDTTDTGPTSTNVQVFARFRPQSVLEEQEGGAPNCFFDPDGRTVSVSSDRGLSTFQFSKVFQPAADQQEVYARVAQPIVTKVVSGINSAIIAYGQTGSGKTYSMMGLHRGWQDDVSGEGEGIVPRALRDLFFAVSDSPEHINYTIYASLVEIYQENISDLLSTDPSSIFLTIREDRRRRLFITDAAQFLVSTAQEVLQLMQRGMRNRETARTKMNDRSSRSHAVVILNVEKRDAVECTLTTSQLYMVDLAGSEVVSKTEAKGAVLEEAKCINSSLFALGRVISALADGAAHVPYRDSKLTRLLQHCFGGSSSTALLVNCSCSSYNRQETVATLQLGARSQTITNTVMVDKVYTAAQLQVMLKDSRKTVARQAAQLSVQEREMTLLRQEAAQLRAQLHKYQTLRGADSAEEVRADTRTTIAQDSEVSEENTSSGSEEGDRSGSDAGACSGAGGGAGVRVGRIEDEAWCEARFVCPVSGRLMRQPTLLADGNTYEESIARRYVSGRYAADPRSPLTGAPLAHGHLTPNLFARMLIQRSCPYNLDEIAPSVSLTLFPPPIELDILSWLDFAPLCRLACTSRHLRAVADQDDLWRALLLSGRHLAAKGQQVFGERFKLQFQRLYRARTLSPEQAEARRRRYLEPSRSRGLTLQPSNPLK